MACPARYSCGTQLKHAGLHLSLVLADTAIHRWLENLSRLSQPTCQRQQQGQATGQCPTNSLHGCLDPASWFKIYEEGGLNCSPDAVQSQPNELLSQPSLINSPSFFTSLATCSNSISVLPGAPLLLTSVVAVSSWPLGHPGLQDCGLHRRDLTSHPCGEIREGCRNLDSSNVEQGKRSSI